MKPFKLLKGYIDPYERPINRNHYGEVSIGELIDEFSNPSLPSYYDLGPNFRCVGVTPRRTNPDTYEQYRHLVFEDIHTGRMIQANVINTEHPMYNYGRQIDPGFYNTHYLDRNETV